MRTRGVFNEASNEDSRTDMDVDVDKEREKEFFRTKLRKFRT